MYRTVTVLVTVRSPQALMQTPELAVNIAAFAGPRSSATSGRASGCGRERADGNATPQVTVFVCVCVTACFQGNTTQSLLLVLSFPPVQVFPSLQGPWAMNHSDMMTEDDLTGEELLAALVAVPIGQLRDLAQTSEYSCSEVTLPWPVYEFESGEGTFRSSSHLP